jgi:hypothetical protein
VKLFEIAKQPIDWNTKSEKQQIAMVRKTTAGIKKIKNPSEAVQLASLKSYGWCNLKYIENPTEAVQLTAVSYSGYAIMYIENPPPNLIKIALTQTNLINSPPKYEEVVNKLFRNNTLLMKKWLRYGEAMRDPE